MPTIIKITEATIRPGYLGGLEAAVVCEQCSVRCWAPIAETRANHYICRGPCVHGLTTYRKYISSSVPVSAPPPALRMPLEAPTLAQDGRLEGGPVHGVPLLKKTAVASTSGLLENAPWDPPWDPAFSSNLAGSAMSERSEAGEGGSAEPGGRGSGKTNPNTLVTTEVKEEKIKEVKRYIDSEVKVVSEEIYIGKRSEVSEVSEEKKDSNNIYNIYNIYKGKRSEVREVSEEKKDNNIYKGDSCDPYGPMSCDDFIRCN